MTTIARVLTAPDHGGLVMYGGVHRHDHEPTRMPPPASRRGSPYARALVLVSRLPAGPMREEVSAFVRYLERDARVRLSPIALARLAEIESECPPPTDTEESAA